MMPNHYLASILRVNLSNGDIHTVVLDSGVTRKYVGGRGVATKILWDETTSDTEPLSPESPLIFMTGPLTGTATPSSSRYIVAGISPLTGILGQATSGGSWADELRHSGWEGIVILGKAPKPVYLWLHDKEAEIRGASHLWGKDTYEVSELLKKETDERAIVAAIGVAGEKLVKLSCIINDGREGRAAARCGLGALMGSKQVKAIVVRGRLPLSVSDESGFKESIAKIYAFSPPAKDTQQIAHSDFSGFKGFIERGGAPIKNWQEGTFDAGYRIAEALRETTPFHCRRCLYSCGESNLTKQGDRHMVWEHWAPLGTNCLIDDIGALQESYRLCNRYGIDTISVGGVVAFAMECYEKGLITKEDAGGLDLSWGNHRAMVELVRQIGEREGLGELLGEGVKRAADQIGGIAHEYAIHVKGLEFPAHDPRAANSLAVQYATGTIGATHVEATSTARQLEAYTPLRSGNQEVLLNQYRDLLHIERLERFETIGKGKLAAKMQNFGSMIDSLVVCNHVLPHVPTPSLFAELLNNVTGWGFSFDEFMKTGERIFNLRRMFCVRRGISRKDDTLPARILTRKRGEGGAADNLPHLGAMLSEYYSYRGWSEEGIPAREKLLELDLNECIE